MTLALRIRTGALAGRLVIVEGELVVGRAPACDLSIPDQRLSRRHARFFLDDGVLSVEDLGSPNGTILNGIRVAQSSLTEGDKILLGKTELAVVTAADDDQPTQPPARAPAAQLIKPLEDSQAPDLERMHTADFLAAFGLVEETQLDPRQDVFALVLRRARSFAILHGVGKAIQREQDPHDMLARVLDLTLEVTGADRGFVARIDDAGTPAIAVVRSKRAGPSEVVLSQTVSDQVIGRRCAVISSDPTADERFADAASLMLSETRSLMAVPILVQNRVLGLIQVESSHVGERFSEADLDLLSMIASTAGVALDNLELAKARERTIAELEEANARLVSAQERLVKSEQLAAIGRFAAGIAHEVRNHLGPFALADVIARDYPNDAKIKDAAEMMREAQQHILDLVNQIRAFARGEETAQEKTRHDVVELVAGVLRFMEYDRSLARAQISLEDKDRPSAELDARSIRQVLINLIRNAADALPERGGRIRIRVHEEDGFALVDVGDNGCGIPPELAARIFEPFFTTKGERGLGLGLDISRQIVVAHGGSLTFTSEPGVGTTFRISLPCTRSA